MKKSLVSACLLLMLMALPFGSISAQDQGSEKISLWYLEERFLLADQNDDARLDKSEMERYAQEFGYYLEPRYFELADQNQDNYLSFQEINHRVESEFLYRYSQDRKVLRELAREHPLLAQANQDYYRNNPSLVQQLFTNYAWLVENPGTAARLYNDKNWTSRFPEVLVSLQENLIWMATNPGEARQLYRNRTTASQLPHLLGWRADHQDFLRKNPKLEGEYQLDFMPKVFRMSN